MKEEGTAPDGTEIHVTRNHGKPTRAQELAKALAEARKAKNAGKAGKKAAPQPAHDIVAPEPAASTTKVEKLAKEGLKPADPDAPLPARGKPAPVASPGPVAKKAKPSATPPPAAERTPLPEPTPAVAPSPRSPKAMTPPADVAPSPPSEPAPMTAKPAVSSVSSSAGASPPRRKAGMQVRFTGMKPLHVVEAALFAAGKPITVEEIAEQTGLPPDKVRDGIKELQAAYTDRDTILEVGKAGTKWAMQVRSQAAEPAAKFAPMEIAPKLLKTLALIAFHQPMKQSQLVDMMGTKVYDHIPELVSRGLVRAREEGVTKILGTTPLFPEYFGLDASDPDEIRALMGRLVGIEAPPKPKAETVYEDPQPQEPGSGPEKVPEQAPEAPPTPAST